MSKNQIHWTWDTWQTTYMPLASLHLYSRSKT